eukprot:CAMPEP_0201492312 /NCGR_PEP_ID=MMETSP0151_2-20130828/32601_1 /ASSEMBLY_ACC=CAM_ASM_000257 /TAXON_ID=200890 /ORGANISM="Paramoeba atlantica, Strain 621/1 / CCAP 1560/9" /LENGTH=282 /DNA_ID=CAMNT_0047879049 /DNA_START=43 /DNA_END=887 /DNA_ORIENTATION=+
MSKEKEPESDEDEYLTKKEKKAKKEKKIKTTLKEDFFETFEHQKRQKKGAMMKERSQQSQEKSKKLRKDLGKKYENGDPPKKTVTKRRNMQLEDFERKRLERRERAEKMTPRDLEVGIHDGELITLLCRNCSQRVNVDSIDKHSLWCQKPKEEVKVSPKKKTQEEEELEEMIRYQQKMAFNRKSTPDLSDLQSELFCDYEPPGKKKKQGNSKKGKKQDKSKENSSNASRNAKQAAQFAEKNPELVGAAYSHRQDIKKGAKVAYDHRDEISQFAKENPELVQA